MLSHISRSGSLLIAILIIICLSSSLTNCFILFLIFLCTGCLIAKLGCQYPKLIWIFKRGDR